MDLHNHCLIRLHGVVPNSLGRETPLHLPRAKIYCFASDFVMFRKQVKRGLYKLLRKITRQRAMQK